jgi:hypothetical protein
MKGSRTAEQELSKRVFNTEHRLTIARALLNHPKLAAATEIAVAARVSGASVHEELHRLADLGVVQRVPEAQRVLFQPIPGPFWEWCRELLSKIPVTEVEASKPRHPSEVHRNSSPRNA